MFQDGGCVVVGEEPRGEPGIAGLYVSVQRLRRQSTHATWLCLPTTQQNSLQEIRLLSLLRLVEP